MKKRVLIFSLCLICVLCLAACGKKESSTGADLSQTYMDDRDLISEANESDFILTTHSGIMELYDVTGKKLDTLKLDGTSKSNFIYCQDEGEIYGRNLLGHTNFTSIFYAVDKTDGKLYIVSNNKNKLKVEEKISLKVSNNIDEIKAYNGLFCYSEKGNGISAEKFEVAEVKDKYSGVIDYMKEVGVERRGKTYTFIHFENLSDKYLKWTNLDSKLSKEDVQNMNMIDIKRKCIRIPFDTFSWVPTNNSIIYFAKDVYGSYDIKKNVITVCYGTDSSVGATYRSGRFASAFALNQMGEHSEKTILFQIDPDSLDVEKALEFTEYLPLDIFVDSSSNVLYMIYKLDNKSTYGKLKIYDLKEGKEINNITFDFVPTVVKGHNGYYYVMNEYESFAVVGNNNSKEFIKVNKTIKETNANDILLCNTVRKDYFLYDAQDRFINEEGYLLDYRGNLINGESQKINKYGQLLDSYGRAINANGELVDKYGNLIDENGVIIQYTQQPDGYYRSSKGIVVDATGKAMIKQEDGTYIIDEEKIPNLEWHYDENGEVVINQDYLDKYPDAASWIGKDGTITKGSYAESVVDKDKKK